MQHSNSRSSEFWREHCSMLADLGVDMPDRSRTAEMSLSDYIVDTLTRCGINNGKCDLMFLNEFCLRSEML